MKKTGKFLLESGVLLTALSLRAKKAGKGIKEYFFEAETIKHISLVLYDLLPLSVKIGMRYEKFHEIFERNFIAIRDALLGKETVVEIVKDDSQQTITTEAKKPVKRVRKAPVKRTLKETKPGKTELKKPKAEK